MESNPSSYTGHCALHGLQHHLEALMCAVDGDQDMALMHLFFAILFDEKVVSKPVIMLNQRGFALDEIHPLIVANAHRQLQGNPQDIPALCVADWGIFPGQDSNHSRRHQSMKTAVRFAESASSCGFYTRILPKLLRHRGCFGAFRGQFEVALCDFRRAVEILREDKSSSMWPEDISGVAHGGSRMREIMIATVEVDIGRCAFYCGRPDEQSRYFGASSGVPIGTHSALLRATWALFGR